MIKSMMIDSAPSDDDDYGRHPSPPRPMIDSVPSDDYDYAMISSVPRDDDDYGRHPSPPRPMIDSVPRDDYDYGVMILSVPRDDDDYGRHPSPPPMPIIASAPSDDDDYGRHPSPPKFSDPRNAVEDTYFMSINGPLHKTILEESSSTIKRRIDNFADIENGEKPIHMSGYRGDTDIIDILINKGAEVNDRDEKGNTPLHYAVKRDRSDAIRHLIERGADVNILNTDGDTPLAYACQHGFLNSAKALAEKHARADIGDSSGDTPLDLALRSEHSDVSQYLISRVDPSVTLLAAKKYPTALLSYLMDIKPISNDWIKAWTAWTNSPVIFPGEILFAKSFCFENEKVNLEEIRNKIEGHYGRSSYYSMFRTLFGKWTTPYYYVVEYMIPIKSPTHPDFLEACILVTESEDDPTLFGKPLLMTVVEAAWRQYGLFIHLIFTVLYVIYMIVINVLSYTFHDWSVSSDKTYAASSTTLLAIAFFLNTVFIFLEILQLYNSVKCGRVLRYFTDIFNLFDWATYSLVFIASIFRFHYRRETRVSASLMAPASMLLWIKGSYFLRPFKSTGIIIRMVFYIIYRVKEVVFILATIVYAFAQTLYLLSYNMEDNRFKDVKVGVFASFFYMMGQSDLQEISRTSVSELGSFLLVIFIVVSTILLLNLLIAFMNSAYGEIQNNQIAEWNREKAKLLIELYSFQPHKFDFPDALVYLKRGKDVNKKGGKKT